MVDPTVGGFCDISSVFVRSIVIGSAAITGGNPGSAYFDAIAYADAGGGACSGRIGEIVVRFFRIQTGFGSQYSESGKRAKADSAERVTEYRH